MTVSLSTADLALVAALNKCGGDVERIGPARWRLALVNGRPFTVSATADTSRAWLHFDADAATCRDRARLWVPLVVNGTLAGAAKIALRPTGLRLRAEIPLEDGGHLGARIASTCSGFRDALSALETGVCTGPAEAPDTGSGAWHGAANLAGHCRASGWAVSERSNGSLAIDLDCAGRFYQAIVERRPDTGVVIRAELVRSKAVPAASRSALGMLLLETTGVLRMARAAATEDDGQASVRFEVAFETVPEAADLHHALSALSAGCSLAGDEARLLQDEAVALRYLALRGAAGRREAGLPAATGTPARILIPERSNQ